jgi:hypothetical protein
MKRLLAMKNFNPAGRTHLAHLLGRPIAPAKKATAPAKRPPAPDAMAVAAGPMYYDFSHLAQSRQAGYTVPAPAATTSAKPIRDPYDFSPPPGSPAAQILAASERASKPSDYGMSAPTGIAKQIINAGRWRDGEKEIP